MANLSFNLGQPRFSFTILVVGKRCDQKLIMLQENNYLEAPHLNKN